ncbi:MAG: hypothetical protein ACLFWD_07965 [Anaerolineales bacterium]
MTILWLLLGLLLGMGLLRLYQAKGSELGVLDWILLALFAIGVVFTLAAVTSFASEPYLNSGRAALVAGFIFGGITLLLGVGTYRKIFAG